jgi:hypothetical protein
MTGGHQNDPDEPDIVTEALTARLDADKASEAEQRRYMAGVALRCFGWAALGIACILWSAHTTSMTYGRMAFYFGVMVGNAGILWTLSAAYLYGERRGYW